MTRAVLTIVLLVACGTASAQYKCVDKTGRVSFQQTPCSAVEKEEKIRIQQADPPKPATPAASRPLTPDQKILANIDRERKAEDRARRVRGLEQQIDETQESINRRSVQMDRELAALRQKKTAANNNLAGATWEQSISTEMQAVTQRYKALNDIDLERLKQLRADLEAAKAAK